MAPDGGAEIAVVGKLAKAIPPKAWTKLVDTACTTFVQCVAPITATTSGIGRLIESRFNKMLDPEKVLASECMMMGTDKANKSGRKRKKNIQAPIILGAIEESSTQTDETMRALWSNLIAQELTSDSVHPEFPMILSRLSAREAHVLADIAKRNPRDKSIAKIIDAFSKSFRIPFVGFRISDVLPDEKSSFEHTHLKLLNVIDLVNGKWELTIIGEAFIKSVSDPSI
jgi:hypothetical protein